MIAPLTKYSWLAGPGIWGYLNIRDDLPAVTSSAKTLHLPSAVGPSSQGRRGSTREILGLDLFYRAEVSYFAALMY